MKNNAKTAIFVVIILALFGILAFLLYNKYEKEKEFMAQKLELAEQEKLTYKLNHQVNVMMKDLDDAKGQNAQISEVVENQKTEIEMQKRKISSLIKEKKNFQAAENELSKLQVQVNGYLSEIKDLKSQVINLQGENQELVFTKDKLSLQVVEIGEQKDSLLVAKSVLEENVTELEETKERLSEKVTRASSIEVNLATIQGIKEKNSGKKANTNKASSMTGLEMCLDLQKNPLVTTGEEVFHVRVVSPAGQTVTNDPNDQIVNNADGSSVSYSFIKQVDYEAGKLECFQWEPDQNFISGIYNVEVYNKGYLVGAGEYQAR